MKKNTFVVISIIFLGFISLIGYIYFSRNFNEDTVDQEQIKYIRYQNLENQFSFTIPSNWKVEDEDVQDTQSVHRESLRIVSAEDGFEITFSSEMIKDNEESRLCEQYNDCGGISDRFVFNYDKLQFPEFVEVDSIPLLLSSSGAVDVVFEEDKLIAIENIETEISYYLYQNHGGGINEELDIFGHNDSKDKFIIGYTFHSESAVQKWTENKAIMKKILETLEWDE